MRGRFTAALVFLAAAPLFAQEGLEERLRSLTESRETSDEPPSDVEEILSRDEFEGLVRGPAPEVREDLVEEWRGLPGRAGGSGTGGGTGSDGGARSGTPNGSGRTEPGSGSGGEIPTCDDPTCDHSGAG
ncbi:MAG: hypothetical protein HY720_00900 [Planctomycetes bacterium]|nr:hypothetical protein [Planctomycetota bacterium]